MAYTDHKTSHLNTLDGLRGVAALSVMTFHWFIEAGSPLFRHSILAVDLFFLMSGFVIAYSYDGRLKAGMPFRTFFAARLVRLYPMILIGIGLGAAWFILDLVITGERAFTTAQFATYFVMNLFMIPLIVGNDGVMFPLNLVLWSLFYELLAYAAYGAIFSKVRTRWLIPVILTGATGVIGWLIFNFDHPAPIVPPAGLAFLAEGFIPHLARIMLSFFLGVLIFRHLPRERLKSAIPAILLPILCVLIFIQPKGALSWWTCMLIITVVFPLILLSAIRAGMSGQYALILKFLGDISYPLYVTHLPVMWATRAVLHKVLPDVTIIWLGIVVLPVCMCVAYIVLRFYDLPVRSLLTQRLKRSSFKAQVQS